MPELGNAKINSIIIIYKIFVILAIKKFFNVLVIMAFHTSCTHDDIIVFPNPKKELASPLRVVFIILSFGI